MEKAYSFFDQFEISRLIPINPMGNLDVSITNSTLFLGLATLYIIFMFQTNVENGLVVPGRYQSVIEVIYETFHDMVRENIPGKDGYRFFPFLLTLGIFILVNNLFGLIPYTFSATSHMAITVAISCGIFIATLLIGFSTWKLDYLSRFMPGGAPLALAPLLVLIEIISYIMTAFVLGVRLAGNIIAGHLLFAILSSFTWQMLMIGGWLAVGSIIPFGITLAVTLLEIAVAGIQAYVFVLLTVIYLTEGLHLH